MDDTWTGGGIYWRNWDDSSTYSGNQFLVLSEPEIIYRNGQKLKAGEQRPNPCWISYYNKILPAYNESITNYNKSVNRLFSMMRLRICGAYTRHYDKPRKFRKKRLF